MLPSARSATAAAKFAPYFGREMLVLAQLPSRHFCCWMRIENVIGVESTLALLALILPTKVKLCVADSNDSSTELTTTYVPDNVNHDEREEKATPEVGVITAVSVSYLQFAS